MRGIRDATGLGIPTILRPPGLKVCVEIRPAAGAREANALGAFAWLVERLCIEGSAARDLCRRLARLHRGAEASAMHIEDACRRMVGFNADRLELLEMTIRSLVEQFFSGPRQDITFEAPYGVDVPSVRLLLTAAARASRRRHVEVTLRLRRPSLATAFDGPAQCVHVHAWNELWECFGVKSTDAPVLCPSAPRAIARDALLDDPGPAMVALLATPNWGGTANGEHVAAAVAARAGEPSIADRLLRRAARHPSRRVRAAALTARAVLLCKTGGPAGALEAERLACGALRLVDGSSTWADIHEAGWAWNAYSLVAVVGYLATRKRGLLELAARRLEKGLRAAGSISPENGTLLLANTQANATVLLALMGQVAQARDHLVRAFRPVHSHPAFLYRCAVLSLRLGDWARARRDIELARRTVEPLLPVFAERLARAEAFLEQQCGNPRRVEDSLRRGLRLSLEACLRDGATWHATALLGQLAASGRARLANSLLANLRACEDLAELPTDTRGTDAACTSIPLPPEKLPAYIGEVAGHVGRRIGLNARLSAVREDEAE